MQPSTWLSCALALGLSASPAPADPLSGWHVQKWSSEQGLPQNNVKAVLQSRSGYLWIGTLMGLARFDGLHFEVFTHTDTPGLVSDTINALAEDRDGKLWLGTQAGLIEWRSGAPKLWTTNHGLPARGGLHQLQAHPAGGLWWRQGGIIGVLHDGRARPFDDKDGLVKDFGMHFYATRRGGILVTSRTGLQRLEPGMSRFTTLERWPIPSDGWCVLEDSADQLWAGSEAGLYRFEGGRWMPQAIAPRLDSQWVTHLSQHSSGAIWMETKQNGMHLLWDGCTEPVTPPGGPWRDVSAACEDRDGAFWLGTAGSGLFRLHPKRIKSWNRADGLPDDEIRTLCAAPDGTVWAGSDRGLARIRNGKAEAVPGSVPAPRQRMGSVAIDAAGVVWVSLFGEGRGVYQFDGRSYRRIEHPALPSNHVHSFHLDVAGRFWIAGRGSVTYHGRDGFGPKLEGPDFNGDATALFTDRRGDVWVGVAGRGLKHCANGMIRSFTSLDGLSDDRPISIHEDADGTLWVGSESGLSRIKDGRVKALRTEDGLTENVINQILEDDSGNFWLGGLRGIYRVRRADLDARADGGAQPVQCLEYGEADGMASSETNGERHPCGGRTPDGHLWFATMGGVVEIDPKRMAAVEPAPPVHIEHLQTAHGVVQQREIAGDSPAPGNPSGLRLPPGSGQVITLRYTTPSLTSAERIRFQYKLEPSDRHWHEAANSRVAFYTHLRPGDYRFLVRASNPHGRFEEGATILAFTLAPRFYERRSLQLAAALFLILVGLAVHQWRIRVVRRLEKLERQQALVSERGRIAQDLHDDLGANLTGLALKAELTRRQHLHPEQLDEHLAGLASTARHLSESMREAIWLTNPRHDTVESLANQLAQQAESLATDAGLRVRLDLPATLPDLTVPSLVRHQLCLAVKEALHNAVKHASAQEIRLALSLSPTELAVSVRDDGRGLTLPAYGDGHGLHNMRERLSRLGGDVEWSQVDGGGTQVLFRLPTRSLSSPPSPP